MRKLKVDIKPCDLLSLYYNNEILLENCLIVKVIKDHYFKKGIIVFFHSQKKHVIDLDNLNGLYFLNT